MALRVAIHPSASTRADAAVSVHPISPISPNAEQQGAAELFAAFFRNRDSEKDALYIRVVTTGIIAVLTGVLPGCIGIALWWTSADFSATFILGSILAVAGTAVFALGVCLVCIVPVAEVDLDTKLAGMPCLRYTFIALFSFVGVSVGIGFGSFYPYFTALPLLLIGLSILFHEPLELWTPERFRLPLSLKLSLFIMAIYVPLINLYFVAATNPILFGYNYFIPGLFSNWAATLQANSGITTPLYSAAACCYVLALVYCGARWATIERRPGWRTSVFYSTLYSVLASTGASGSLINLTALNNADAHIVRASTIPPALSIMLVILLPLVVTAVYGQKKIFTLLARYFELSLSRLQHDGALMAELVSLSRVVDSQSMTRWLYRAQDAPWHKSENADDVNRVYWMKGRILSFEHVPDGKVVLLVSVSMAEDNDTSWRAHYEGKDLVVGPVPDRERVAEAGPPAAAPDFYAWRDRNFKGSDVSAVDDGAQAVQVRVVLESAKKSHEDLLSWAKGNLRVFRWESFSDDVLETSPRNLKDDEMKKKAYALSQDAVVQSHADKIDFFVSHSWDDDSVSKCRALRQFMEQQRRRHARFPSLWLDKVCIDQRDSCNALAVLPINIGSSKRMLILLSPSYLKRLWCVWELFTLFSFCNADLALERIEVVPLESSSSPSSPPIFSLSHSHCFDPNEEFKLRQIITLVGTARLEIAVRFLVAKFYTGSK